MAYTVTLVSQPVTKMNTDMENNLIKEELIT